MIAVLPKVVIAIPLHIIRKIRVNSIRRCPPIMLPYREPVPKFIGGQGWERAKFASSSLWGTSPPLVAEPRSQNRRKVWARILCGEAGRSKLRQRGVCLRSLHITRHFTSVIMMWSSTSYDGSGLWVCAKRLDRGRFRWPDNDSESIKVTLTAEELALLLGGIDLRHSERRRWHRALPAAEQQTAAAR